MANDAKQGRREAQAQAATGATEKILGPGASGDPNDPGELGEAPATLIPAELEDAQPSQPDGAPPLPDYAAQRDQANEGAPSGQEN